MKRGNSSEPPRPQQSPTPAAYRPELSFVLISLSVHAKTVAHLFSSTMLFITFCKPKLLTIPLTKINDFWPKQSMR